MRNLRWTSGGFRIARDPVAALTRTAGRDMPETGMPLASASTAMDLFLADDPALPRMIYPGARIEGRYWVEEEIGVGGLCLVHRVRDEQTGHVHALKSLQPGFAAMPFYFDLMKREAEIQMAIRHDHILGCDRMVSAEDGRHALLLPFLAGGTLSQRIRTHGPLSATACHDLLATMLEALACLARNGITHLDIAPDNIMFADDGPNNIRLIDFGLSRRSGVEMLPGEADLFLGKDGWAAPEMIAGEDTTPDSDLFSLGLVAHFALTGDHPLAAGDFRVEPHCRIPDVSDCCPTLQAILAALLSRNPASRRNAYRYLPAVGDDAA